MNDALPMARKAKPAYSRQDRGFGSSRDTLALLEKFPAGKSPLKHQVAEGELGAELASVNTLSQRLALNPRRGTS
jgi:hypothetical protein